MAKLSTDELLDAFKEMTLLELSDFVKQFEDDLRRHRSGAGRRRCGCTRWRRGSTGRGRGGEGRVRRHPRGRGREEDPGHQGGAHAHQPGPEGGQGSCRRRSQASPREGQQGGRRQGQGGPRGCRRHRHRQVTAEFRGAVRPSTPDLVRGRTAQQKRPRKRGVSPEMPDIVMYICCGRAGRFAEPLDGAPPARHSFHAPAIGPRKPPGGQRSGGRRGIYGPRRVRPCLACPSLLLLDVALPSDTSAARDGLHFVMPEGSPRSLTRVLGRTHLGSLPLR